MILELKDGRLMGVIRMGETENPEMTDTVKGVDLESEDTDLFGRPVIVTFHFSDVTGIFGSYTFAPDEWNIDAARRNVILESYRRIRASRVENADEQPQTGTILGD